MSSKSFSFFGVLPGQYLLWLGTRKTVTALALSLGLLGLKLLILIKKLGAMKQLDLSFGLNYVFLHKLRKNSEVLVRTRLETMLFRIV